MTRASLRRSAALLLLAAPGAAWADNLYVPGSWSSLATDRSAHHIGDLLTVLVYENASATNSANSRSQRNGSVRGGASAGHFDKSAGLDLAGGSENSGTTARSGQMVAQISVKVDAVGTNGDLDVSGQQLIHINGERTLIKIRGRVRTADITSGNTVLSTRLADAAIDYDGRGFVSRSGRLGPISKIFSWLGLL
jgi:flagellar L-ring protein precursor FlgH